MGIQSVAVHSDVDSSAVSCYVFADCLKKKKLGLNFESLYFSGNSCQNLLIFFQEQYQWLELLAWISP